MNNVKNISIFIFQHSHNFSKVVNIQVLIYGNKTLEEET